LSFSASLEPSSAMRFRASNVPGCETRSDESFRLCSAASFPASLFRSFPTSFLVCFRKRGKS
jgi:hypothetical protein